MLRKLYRMIANRSHPRIVTIVNKILIRWGVQPLFTGTRKQLHQYWMLPPEEVNKPEAYLEGRGRSEYLTGLMKRFGNQENTILELGCNVGRNLLYLWQNGLVNLSGIEMNEHALEIVRTSFPECGQVSIYKGLLEEVLPRLEDKKFDIIFSMAVLEHIHPQSNFIFKEIVRVCKKYIITIEIEHSSGARVFPRNYREVFEKLGCAMVYHEEIKESCCELKSYTARIFKVK